MNFGDLKTRAKKSLSGKWGNVLAVFILYGILTGIVSSCVSLKYGQQQVPPSVSTISWLCTTAITALFVLGYNTFFLKISRDEDVEVALLWSKVNQFVRAFVAVFLLAVIIAAGCILLIVPGIIFALMFSMTMYIMADDEEISAVDAMKKSAEMMKGHKMDLFLLCLSFIGWMILGIFTLFILYLWLIPYMNVTLCNFYNAIKEEKK